jgi:hypothetical protein
LRRVLGLVLDWVNSGFLVKAEESEMERLKGLVEKRCQTSFYCNDDVYEMIRLARVPKLVLFSWHV